MSAIPSHGGLSHRISNVDRSHHDTSYGYTNSLGQHASGQGIINNINPQTTNYNTSYNPLAALGMSGSWLITHKHCLI
jgi:hypothetical protein